MPLGRYFALGRIGLRGLAWEDWLRRLGRIGRIGLELWMPSKGGREGQYYKSLGWELYLGTSSGIGLKGAPCCN